MKPGRLGIEYLKSRHSEIIAFITFILVFLVTAWIYSTMADPILYALEIVIVLQLVFAGIDFFRFNKKHRVLQELATHIDAGPERLPEANSLIEQDYHQIIRTLHELMLATRTEYDVRRSEMTDYYTLWAHQIKTPISAMNLLLHSGETNTASMEQELFKIEQYVEMVLGYLRSESLSADIVLKSCSIDEMVRQAVKKYAILFIGKKIALELGDLTGSIVTDEKWFVFAVEQILSNALKYTPENGKVSIRLRGEELILEDTGIGILPEDLPRIFDRGFTGHNGRAHKKSTGIGLYLCKRILSALHHTIRVESGVGTGTRFSINLKQDLNLSKL